MWRFNSENWERRKSHLIRSLFHDIPLLSPVPEGSEPSCSPGALTRPPSPLPPLIIERIPDHHDEPEEYYRDLEIRMRKVYRKLFYDETSSSVDSILAQYDDEGDHRAVFIVADDYLDKNTSTAAEDSDNDLNAFTPAIHDKNNSENTSSIPPQSEFAASTSTMRVVDYNRNNSSLEVPQDQQSSTESTEADTQVTTQVIIHEPPPNLEDLTQMQGEGNLSLVYDDVETPLSPVLGSQVTVGRRSYCPEMNDQEKDEDSDISRIINSEESSEQELTPQNATREEISSEANESSNDTSIEVMRRPQSIAFRSLGSNQHSNSDKMDNTQDINIGFIRRTFSDLHSDDDNATEIFEDREEEISLQYDDFGSMTYTSSPIISRNYEHDRNKRSNEEASFGDEFVSKRIKSRVIGVQTSFLAQEGYDWDFLKSNFFVGNPLMYKLCACENHKCTSN